MKAILRTCGWRTSAVPVTDPTKRPEAERQIVFSVADLSVHYGPVPAVAGVSCDIAANEITAFIGPSGCGKSTVLRCFNRMNDLVPGALVTGSVRYKGRHLGYVTVVSYPNRDITALTEGSPYSEVVIADLREEHVALLQRYKEHWLIHCGGCYGITGRGGELGDGPAMRIAQNVLLDEVRGAALVDRLEALLERELVEPFRQDYRLLVEEARERLA